ncbi:MAG TPA: oligoribonuclease [Verrucomicrobiae bacterium]|nr:oligoribonuclease [Verrucomicrobiae bacterium]
MKKQNKNNLVWLDMEMTGLNPEKEVIIEMATIVTDSDLNILAEGPSLVLHQPAKYLKAMDEWNTNQHTKSGLVDQVKKSKITPAAAEKKTLAFLKDYCVPGKSPLCGNSIHHDRRFVIKYMPRLNAYLHYRHLDVSTIKGLIDRWYPKNKDLPKKSDSHRALDDIRESIEELRFYRKTYFVKP